MANWKETFLVLRVLTTVAGLIFSACLVETKLQGASAPNN